MSRLIGIALTIFGACCYALVAYAVIWETLHHA